MKAVRDWPVIKPYPLGSLEKGIRPYYVAFDKRIRALYGAVYMRFSRKMDYGIDLFFTQQLLD